MENGNFEATGKRKEAIARVKISSGNGKKTVNGKPLEQYLAREDLIFTVNQPLQLTNMEGKVDMVVWANGGGITAQAGAIRLGLSKALVQMNSDWRKTLKDAGFLTRDPRMVERKKYGQIKARKRYQYSKR
ncbi:MAG: 30S ribosomal protein S9 [candidate division Zixibacteria bacterium RBG_16_40_9]|nr:MAG: 30S ribosomal protein S9 [candidate division Zixibacteria bacterium RBG_16_40_9]